MKQRQWGYICKFQAAYSFGYDVVLSTPVGMAMNQNVPHVLERRDVQIKKFHTSVKL
jgi:hypothetical protein